MTSLTVRPMGRLTGGDLQNYIARKRYLSGAEAKFVTFQILTGLDVSPNHAFSQDCTP